MHCCRMENGPGHEIPTSWMTHGDLVCFSPAGPCCITIMCGQTDVLLNVTGGRRYGCGNMACSGEAVFFERLILVSDRCDVWAREVDRSSLDWLVGATLRPCSFTIRSDCDSLVHWPISTYIAYDLPCSVSTLIADPEFLVTPDSVGNLAKQTPWRAVFREIQSSDTDVVFITNWLSTHVKLERF